MLGKLDKDQLGELARMVAANLRTPVESPPEKPRKRKPKKTIKYLTELELKSLFAAISDEGNIRDQAIFEVALNRGLRASEVGKLMVGHLHMEKRRLFVERLKNGNSGEYPLTDPEVKALRAWLRKRGNHKGPLFPSRFKKPISRSQLDRLMKRYGAAAGIPADKRHFHCLRHTCGTQLRSGAGADLKEIQDHLGHVSISSTAIYAQITDKKRDEVGDRISKGLR